MSLVLGGPAPFFTAPSPGNPKFVFGSLGGRYVLLVLLPAPGPERDRVMALVNDHRGLFSDEKIVLFGVLPDVPSFEEAKNEPPWRWFADVNGEIRGLYDIGPQAPFSASWILIDPSLRILGFEPLDQGQRMFEAVSKLGEPQSHAGVPLHAPVLIVPRVFERGLCRLLIQSYKDIGGRPSGVMRADGGKTLYTLSDDFKKRRDADIANPLRAETLVRINHRLVPEIAKAFHFTATRIERFIVVCYDADEGGYFRPHRDNTTPATLHRKFAVSINLNAEDFEGGDLRFPEFGVETYRPPTGGAVVFSTALLHEVTPVVKGARYAFLPFLYDEAGERVRAENQHSLMAN